MSLAAGQGGPVRNKMAVTRANRVAIDAASGNLRSLATFNRVIPANENWAGGHKRLEQEQH